MIQYDGHKSNWLLHPKTQFAAGMKGWSGWRKLLIISPIKEGSVSFFRPSLAFSGNGFSPLALLDSTQLNSTNPILSRQQSFLLPPRIFSGCDPFLFLRSYRVTPGILAEDRRDVDNTWRKFNTCVERLVHIWAVLSLSPWKRAPLTPSLPTRPSRPI